MWCLGWRKIGCYCWLLACLLGGGIASAEPARKLILLTELWPPYVIRDANGKLTGADLELAQVVLAQLGYQTEVRALPWKRVLQQARLRDGDAVVDIFYLTERKNWLHYPDEPLSRSGEVLFYPLARPIRFEQLADLKGLRIGIQADYAYSKAFLNDEGVKRVVMTGEGNAVKQLHLMMSGRLDGVVLNERVGNYLLASQGLQDQVGYAVTMLSDDDRNFIAFTHKPGHDQLAIRFSAALKQFKQTPAYKRLLARYQL